MIKLKPCPFCGGEPELIFHTFNLKPPNDRSFGVRCTKCLAETWQYFDSVKEAVKAWNRSEDHDI